MSAKRSEYSENAVNEPADIACFKICKGAEGGFGLSLEEIRFKIFYHFGFEENGIVFKVEIKASVIEIDSADSGDIAVNDTALCMNETGGIFIDFYTGFHESSVISP